MQYEVIPTQKFKEDLSFYKCKRLYRHVVDDIGIVIRELKQGNLIGDEIPGLHLPEHECTFKVRAANSDTKQGKSNGYRIIYYAYTEDCTIYLLTVYYKKDDIRVVSKQELIDIIKRYCSKSETDFLE